MNITSLYNSPAMGAIVIYRPAYYYICVGRGGTMLRTPTSRLNASMATAPLQVRQRPLSRRLAERE